MGMNLLDKGYNDVPATMPGEFSRLPAGGYVCQVCNAQFTKSKAGNDMLMLFVDIAEGDFKGYFKDATRRVKTFNKDNQWDKSGIYYQLVFNNDDKISPFFKGLLICFGQSNPSLKFPLNNFSPDILRGQLIGFVFAEEEYKWNGEIKSRLVIKFPKTVEDIRNGNFTVPPIKRFSETAKPDDKSDPFPNSTPIDPDDVPF